MNVDKKTLYKIAHLARLEINPDNEEKMLEDLSKIISWVDKLSEVDTDGIEPLISMSHEINMLREDEVLPSLDHEKALKLAPKKDSDFFRVPKVIE